MGSFISNTVAPAAQAWGTFVNPVFGNVMTGGGLTHTFGNGILGGMAGGGAGSANIKGPDTLIDPRQLGVSEGILGSQQAFNQNYGSQQNLANQLQARSVGAGPNPAQIALQQGTNRAIEQGSGMIASQKGISPALAQRLASQNAASMSQKAAGQGALIGSQQQAEAQNALGGLYGQMGNQQLSMNSNLQNALAAWNNNQVGMQSNMNSANASLQGGQNAMNGQMMGGLMQGIGAAGMMAMMAASGGEVPSPQKMASGGEPKLYDWGFNTKPFPGEAGPASFAGQYLNNSLQKGVGDMSTAAAKYFMSPSDSEEGPSQDFQDSSMAQNTPGNYIQPLSEARGGMIVPGQAKVKGDSLKNDKVPAMLSPKEIVLPRSVTMHPDAPRKAAEFVAAVQARHGKKMPEKKSA